jgi:hypothetical protein
MAEACNGRVSGFEDGDGRIAFPMTSPTASPMTSPMISPMTSALGDGLFHADGTLGARQAEPSCVPLTGAKVEERILPDKAPRALPVSGVAPSFVRCSHG